MSTHDDDPDDLDPETEPTSAERARARSFAELVDKVVAGRAPAAMSAEDRPLVETASTIHAAHRVAAGSATLTAARRDALIERALTGALEGEGGHAAPAAVVPPPHDQLAARRASSSLRARAPWLVAGVSTLIAAAAVLALWLRPPTRVAVPSTSAPVARQVPETWRSRPADPLIGVIPRERDGDAASRIDAIFADRLDGYRDRTLQGGGR